MLADENGGQTLTFVMFGVCGLLFVGFGIYALIEGVRSNNTTIILGGAVMIAAPLSLAYSWRQRDAG